MKSVKTILAAVMALAALALAFPAGAQTNSHTGILGFGETVKDYFSSLDTNSVTWAQSKYSLWTGASSVQGGNVALVNDLGISYQLTRFSEPMTNAPTWTSLSLEAIARNSGVAGTFVSGQLGPGFNVMVYDVRLTAYLHGGYNEQDSAARWYGEAGVRISKALSKYFFAGVGIGIQFPKSEQVFSVFTGAAF